MKLHKKTVQWTATILLVLWCGVFLRMETTEKSMVRALILYPDAEAWTVELLYQFPEAAADASDASAEIRVCSATEKTLAQAVQAAERSLPKTANYRLCEYLLWDEDATTGSSIREVEEFLQVEPISRLSARVFLLTGESLQDAPSEEAESDEDTKTASADSLPGMLLQAVEEQAACAPRLYEIETGMLLPILRLEEDTAALEEAGVLITEQGNTRLSAEETAMARLLTERAGPQSIELETRTVFLRRGIISVEAKNDGFAVRLSCQRQAGMPMASAEQCRELEMLCIQTVTHCWESGWDLLHLGAVRALQQGESSSLTTKNACPTLRADVRFLEF